MSNPFLGESMARARSALASTLLLSTLAVSHAALAADPVKIGVPIALSGPASVVAPSTLQAAQLAVDEINAKGGILGRQVAIETADGAGITLICIARSDGFEVFTHLDRVTPRMARHVG